MQGRSLFIFGLGYSTTGLARKAQAEQWTVTSTCRNTRRFGGLERPQHRILEFDPAAGKVLNDDGLQALHTSHHVISSIPPIAAKLYDPVLRAQHRVLQIVAQQPGCNIQALAYLSSTGVYGDWQGAWVDERSAPRTATARGILRLEAEGAWATLADQLLLPLTIFRLGGIYGPMRSVLHNLRRDATEAGSGNNSSSSTARRSRQRYTSRCHVADVVAAIQADMRRRTNSSTHLPTDRTDTCQAVHQDQSESAENSQPQQSECGADVLQARFVEIVNVVDNEPAPRGDVEAFARQLLASTMSEGACTVAASSEPVAEHAQQTVPKRQQLQQQHQEEEGSQQSADGEQQVGSSTSQQQQQQHNKQKRSLTEPLEEKRVRNDKLKALIQVDLMAATYREGLTAMHAGNIEPFAPEDLSCLYGQASCIAEP